MSHTPKRIGISQCEEKAMRKRFTPKSNEWWNKVLEYAEATNHTSSQLICEALDQMMARYPKRRHKTESELDVLASQVATRLGLRVPAGTSGANPDGGSNP